MQPITIIGAGLAGYTVARELRKLDKTVPLAIITTDDGGFYSKPMLSNAFAQNKSPGQLVTQSATQMATQLSAQVLARTHVTGIDSAAKILSSSAGDLSYSTLVIAAGAQAIKLPIEGNAADQVLSINHVDDYAMFRAQLALTPAGRTARVVILGAGLIGCEFADDLAGAGHAVTLIDPNPLPLAALAAPALSQGLHTALTARGITLHLGTTAARVDRPQHDLRVTLANGTTLDTDIVLSAVGLRPDLTLARTAGLSIGRGIVVDATGQTSAPHIYALGDCAEYTLDDNRSGALPYIAPLMSAARAIARTLAGEATTIVLKAAPVLVKTPSYPLALLPPPPASIGAWHASTEDGRTVCRFHDPKGVLLGFGVAPHDTAIRQRLLTELEQASWPKLA